MNKILVVEDDHISRLAFQMSLQSHFNVDVELDFDRINELYQSCNYGLVLMDINLGKGRMNGIEVMKKLKELNPQPSSKFVAVTAYSMPGDKEMFLNEGFDGFLSKPVDFNELPKILLSYIK